MDPIKWFVIITCLVCLTACDSTLTQSTINDKGDISSFNTGQSMSRIDQDGEQSASHSGPAPTLTKLDAEGTWNNTAGQLGVLGYNPETGNLYLLSPNDTEIAEFTITPEPAPGQPSVVIKGLKTNISSHASVLTAQYHSAAALIAGMAPEVAKVKLEQARQTGEITEAAFQALMPIVQGFITGGL